VSTAQYLYFRFKDGVFLNGAIVTGVAQILAMLGGVNISVAESAQIAEIDDSSFAEGLGNQFCRLSIYSSPLMLWI
jgi:hypothetical protein